MRKLLTKNWLLSVAAVINIVLLLWQPQRELSVLRFTGKNFMNFLFMLTPVFICIGLMDVWIDRACMVKIMGEKSGFRGALTAMLSGMVTAVVWAECGGGGCDCFYHGKAVDGCR